MNTAAFSMPLFLEQVRDGVPLAESDLRHFISHLSEYPDEQTAAFLAHAYHKPLARENTVQLTLAMRDSGAKLDWRGIDKPVVDKHSTGGIGDKVTICMAPLVAALGLAMPTIAGRGLGFSGGTADKLEAIPGMRLDLDAVRFQSLVRECGTAFGVQTDAIAPADKKLYALRDVTATVESIPLITASILSKKLAESLDCLVMDVKWGSGAFMTTMERAQELARSIVTVANGAGTKTRALVTDMNQALGLYSGNWCEVAEAALILKNDASMLRDAADTVTLTKELTASLLLQTGLAPDHDAAMTRINASWQSGKPFEIFQRVIAAQGGDASLFDKPFDAIGKTVNVVSIASKRDGFLTAVHAKSLGQALILGKAGREKRSDAIDSRTSLKHPIKIGQKVAAGQVLCEFFTDHAQNLGAIRNLLDAAYVVSDAPAVPHPLIREVIA